MRLLGWTLTQYGWCLYKKKLGHRHRGKTMWGLREKMTTYKPRRDSLEETNSVVILSSDFHPPEL